MHILLSALALLSIAAAALFSYRADKRRAVPYPWLTAGLRALTVAFLWALLLAPFIRINKTETEKPVIVILQDESTSIPTALKGDTATYRRDAEELAKKLAKNYRVVTWGFGSTVQMDSLYHYRQPATDISAPLARAAEFFGSQNLGAVILATDGRYNTGLHPLYQPLPMRSPLYTVSIGDTALPKDLRIAQVYANRRVAKGAQIEIRADIVATRCGGYNGSITISEAGSNGGSNTLSITTDRFNKAVTFSVKAGAPGLHHYIISAPPAAGEDNTANNRRDVFVEVVEAKKRILIAAAAPHPDVAALQEALRSTDAYTIATRAGEALPASLSDYDVVILHGPPTGDASALRGKSVWYIVSQSASPFITSVANLSINAAAQHDAYAAVNSSFSAFTLPAGTTSVLDRLPPLGTASGSVTTGAGTQTLFNQRGSSVPLWMVQAGSAPQALTLGEGLWRWRLYEYRYFHNHNVVDECIRQTVALLATNMNDAPFRAELPKHEWRDGENITFNAYLLNAAGEQINSPEAALVLTDSSGRKQTFSFEKSGAAYRLAIGSLPGGTYNYIASTSFNGRSYSAGGSFIVTSIPLEAMESGADYPLLYALSKKYGGSTIRSPQMANLYDSITRNTAIKPVIESRETTVPLVDWKWFFFLLLLVATVEWLLRKYWLAQ